MLACWQVKLAGKFFFSWLKCECPVRSVLVLVGQAGVRGVCCGGASHRVLVLVGQAGMRGWWREGSYGGVEAHYVTHSVPIRELTGAIKLIVHWDVWSRL